VEEKRRIEGSKREVMNMRKGLGIVGSAFAAAMVVAAGAAGCSGDSAEREKTIREEAAKAAAEAKPKIEEAGRAVKAAVDGAKEGWENGQQKKVDLNAATVDELTELPGIGKHEARRIVAGRPYHDKHDLVSKKILSAAAYEKLKDEVAVK
jgi:DNA uptake protein ComE-like DNA-binding protein